MYFLIAHFSIWVKRVWIKNGLHSSSNGVRYANAQFEKFAIENGVRPFPSVRGIKNLSGCNFAQSHHHHWHSFFCGDRSTLYEQAKLLRVG